MYLFIIIYLKRKHIYKDNFKFVDSQILTIIFYRNTML